MQENYFAGKTTADIAPVLPAGKVSSSVSAEQIPKSAKYVEIVQGGKVRDLIDVESTIIKTKKNDTKTGRYGDIIYTIFYKIKT
jgi:hypothetical protein